MAVFLHSPLKLRFKTWQMVLEHTLKHPLEGAEFRKACKKQSERIAADPRGTVVALKGLDATHTLQEVHEDFPSTRYFCSGNS